MVIIEREWRGREFVRVMVLCKQRSQDWMMIEQDEVMLCFDLFVSVYVSLLRSIYVKQHPQTRYCKI